MFRRVLATLFLAAIAMVAGTASAVELPGPLVTAVWLQQHRAEVNIIDVREDVASFTKAPKFATDGGKKSLAAFGGHIPGALLLDFAKVRTTRTVDGRELQWMLPDRATFQALMRATGVQAGRPTVIVSDGAGGGDLDMAARVYWSMKVYGDTRLAILNGGTTAWLEAGYPVSTVAASPGGGNWTAGPGNRKLFADSNDVAKAVAAGKQLVDARPLPFYLGFERKAVVLASGHIGGAVNFPPDVRSNKVDGSVRFLTAPQYAAVFGHLDINPHKATITYCNTGHLASGAWFVLSEIMKNPDVAVYDGSMYEWTTEKRPVVGLP
ncbi:MAG TPA: rhodanese-like domain-containing protein [Rhodanobacteraceae bacterium]|nr:rhodanese-like domain-containing protein [Rhodanobacteraceae bacterium]